MPKRCLPCFTPLVPRRPSDDTLTHTVIRPPLDRRHRPHPTIPLPTSGTCTHRVTDLRHQCHPPRLHTSGYPPPFSSQAPHTDRRQCHPRLFAFRHQTTPAIALKHTHAHTDNRPCCHRPFFLRPITLPMHPPLIQSHRPPPIPLSAGPQSLAPLTAQS